MRIDPELSEDSALLRAEIRRLQAALQAEPTLTDAEREAVELAYSRLTTDARYTAVAATLQGLLNRMK